VGARLLAAVAAVSLVLAGCGNGPDAARPGGGEYVDTSPPPPCVGQTLDEPGYAAPAGASTTALGPQPAPYELQAPAGRPRGVAIVLHGGGWVGVGTRQLVAVRPDAARWLERGWATANLDYRACRPSLGDVLQMHDAIRARIGPDAPIVAVGESAGAHLALMLAVLRPDSVRGVVAQAPPTDPETLAKQTVRDPATGGQTNDPPRQLSLAWHGAFQDALAETSPVRRAREIRARVLLARSETDPLIPAGQLTDMADALRAAHGDAWVRVLELDGGDVDFPHATISAAAERRFEDAEDDVARPWRSAGPTTPAVVDGWWATPGP
jgi:acetyl esterase/lipase